MKLIAFLLSLACHLLVMTSGSELHRRDWVDWKTFYGKSYAADEELSKFVIWEKNLFRSAQHNAEADQGIHSYKTEMNMFGDLDKISSNILLRHTSTPCNMTSSVDFSALESLPEFVDWRRQGAVTPVQNQGNSGQSWTFSATGALEAQNFIKSGQLVKLSEENLAECATEGFSPYCAVGSPECAFYYVNKNNGIDTEEGYVSKHDGKCHFDPAEVGCTCKGCFTLQPGDEHSLQMALASTGPVSAVINGGQISFQLYSSGIYDDPGCDSQHLNHDVLVVGYGAENGNEFWIVKNSWGDTWGENGYVRIARNKGDMCGIAARASYPVV